jgi:hypothetical protein
MKVIQRMCCRIANRSHAPPAAFAACWSPPPAAAAVATAVTLLLRSLLLLLSRLFCGQPIAVARVERTL